MRGGEAKQTLIESRSSPWHHHQPRPGQAGEASAPHRPGHAEAAAAAACQACFASGLPWLPAPSPTQFQQAQAPARSPAQGGSLWICAQIKMTEGTAAQRTSITSSCLRLSRPRPLIATAIGPSRLLSCVPSTSRRSRALPRNQPRSKAAQPCTAKALADWRPFETQRGHPAREQFPYARWHPHRLLVATCP